MVRDRRLLKWYQNTDWFNENLIVIKASYPSAGDKIKKECKQRNITHYYGDHHIYRGDVIDGRLVDRDEYKIKIKETGPKVKQLVEWALNRFNTRERIYVWIEIQDLKPEKKSLDVPTYMNPKLMSSVKRYIL